MFQEPILGSGWAIWGKGWVWIGCITLLGALLRFFGIFHGLQDNFLYHPDSKITLYEAWPKHLGEDWLTGSYNGALYNLLLSQAIGMVETLVRFFGYSQWAWSLEKISVAGSLLGAILGTLTIPVVYLLGRHAYQKKAGVIGAIFLSLCPLHTFHSHYPYRDVPMVFFLSLTLLFCIWMVKKPTLLNAALGWVTALATVGMKPAGLVIIVPLIAAVTVVLCRDRKRWPILIPIGLIAGLGLIFFSRGGISFRFTNLRNLMVFLATNREGLWTGLATMATLLIQWLGFPYLLASLAGLGYGVWRRASEDIILVSFQITAVLAAASYFWLDERFLVFLLPVMAVMLGRLAAEGWRACFNRRILRSAIFLILAGLAFQALARSTWQGILFTLPDTRAVSGKWFEAHFPKNIRIAMEEYYPLGVSQWPKASFINPLQTVDQEAAKTDLLVTSSLMHQRYILDPDRYPKESAFIKSLQEERSIIKKFSVGPLGFIHPDIAVYLPDQADPQVPQLLFPRPYDSRWNLGLSFLTQGPFDRDDRTVQVDQGHKYTATLVSPITGQEMMVFVLNGPEPGVVKVRVGYQTKIKMLKPDEFDIITFRPKWLFLKKPALYPFEAGMPSGRGVLLQLRCGNREIGEALVKWGQYERAVPYLKRAIAEEDLYEAELRLLLGTVYKKLSRFTEAKESIRHLIDTQPQFINVIRSLGRSELPTGKWEDSFRRLTNLNPALMRYALSQEYEAEELFLGPSGQVQKDGQAFKGQGIVFEKGRHVPGEVLSGPVLRLEQGPYQAGFSFRAREVNEAGVMAVIKVLADNRLIAALPLRSRPLSGGRDYQEVTIPFVHTDQRAEIEFQVLATGRASFSIDKIRIAPDLRKLFEKKRLDLDSFTEK